MTILNQGVDGRCKNCSFLSALEIMGVIKNPQEILDKMTNNLLTNERAIKYFNENGFKLKSKRVSKLQFKGVLARGIPIITGFNGYDVESVKIPPFLAKFNDDRVHSHSFIIVSYENGLLKVQNSWGENECDKGYFYIDSKDIKRLINPIIIEICNQPTQNT